VDRGPKTEFLIQAPSALYPKGRCFAKLFRLAALLKGPKMIDSRDFPIETTIEYALEQFKRHD
jgi:hypothetical protein